MLSAPSSSPSFVVLCRRRTGARCVYDLLAGHSLQRRLGHEPFHWERPLGEVSRLFHASDAATARSLLDASLATGVIFRHPYETESWAFNSLVLDALKANGARALLFERSDESERLFSLVVALHYGAWTRSGVDTLRDRLRRNESTPAVDLAWVRQLVRGELLYKQWFDTELAKTGIEVLRCTYEQLFRSGTRALAVADELFAFAGLGSRVSQLDDASLLRVAFGGEQHTLGLLDYSDDLRRVQRTIVEELSNPIPPPPATKPDGIAATALPEAEPVATRASEALEPPSPLEGTPISPPPTPRPK